MSRDRFGRPRFLGSLACARSVGTTVGVLTFTGSIGGLSCAAFGSSSPRRYSCRQANTWLGLRLCRRATVATEAPRTCVSRTMRSFSSIVCCRRGPVRRPSESTSTVSAPEVSTYSLRGHLRCVHLAHHRHRKLG